MPRPFLARVLVVVCGLCGAWPGGLAAQSGEFPQGRFKLGPLGIQPQIVSSIGIDTNVFNEVSDPQRDTVMHIRPEAWLFLRMGRASLQAQVRASGEYYREHPNQSSLNPTGQVTLRLPFTRVSPYVHTALIYTRERTGFEVDARPRRDERTLAAGADIRIGARTTLGLAARRATSDFAETAVFRGVNLQRALNRELVGLGLSARYELSSLTTMAFTADAARDRFPFMAAKNAGAVRLGAGLEFNPRALLTGSFTLGYLQFTPATEVADDYRGLFAAADIAYVLRGRTRLALRGSHDVTYSFESFYPYYLLTTATATVTHRLGDHWELNGFAGKHRLRYAPVFGATGTSPTGGVLPIAPDDDAFSLGTGIGYYLTPATLLGVTVEHLDRRSPVRVREYRATRSQASIGIRF